MLDQLQSLLYWWPLSQVDPFPSSFPRRKDLATINHNDFNDIKILSNNVTQNNLNSITAISKTFIHSDIKNINTNINNGDNGNSNIKTRINMGGGIIISITINSRDGSFAVIITKQTEYIRITNVLDSTAFVYSVLLGVNDCL